ncbi:hypothetical protein CR513_50560, partial [Mucuna pruriens]
MENKRVGSIIMVAQIHHFHLCFMTERQLPYEHLSPLQAAVGVIQKCQWTDTGFKAENSKPYSSKVSGIASLVLAPRFIFETQFLRYSGISAACEQDVKVRDWNLGPEYEVDITPLGDVYKLGCAAISQL